MPSINERDPDEATQLLLSSSQERNYHSAAPKDGSELPYKASSEHSYGSRRSPDGRSIRSDVLALSTSSYDKLVTGSNDTSPQHVTYWQRWYILTVFSLLAIWSATAWNTWGPISDTSKVVFNWNDGEVALLTNWSFITMVTYGVFCTWMMDVKGLRPATISSAGLLFIGLAVRALPVGIDNVV